MLQPFAIMMTGIPASGKSTFRSGLSERLHNFDPVTIAPDDIVDAVAKHTGKFYREIYASETVRSICFDASFHRIDEAIRNQRNIILDRTYINREQRQRVMARFGKQPVYRFLSVSIDLPTDVPEWIGRLDSRIGKEIPPSILFDMIRRQEPVGDDEGFEHRFKGQPGLGLELEIVNYIRESSL